MTSDLNPRSATILQPAVDLTPHRSILAVESSPVVRRFMARALTQAGYGVVLVEQSEVALALLGRADFPADLVCIEQTPHDDAGLSLFAAARAIRPHLPCVLMATGGLREVAVRGRAAGVAAVVEKPFTVGILLEAVRGALAHGSPDALRIAMALYPTIGCHA